MAGTKGAGHSRDIKIVDPVKQYIWPVKALAVIVVDLPYGGAEAARKVMEGFEPKVKQ